MIFLRKNSSRIKTVAQMLINFIFQWWKNLAQNTICAHSRHIANQIMQSSLFVQYLLRLTAVFVIKTENVPSVQYDFSLLKNFLLLSGYISVLQMKIVRRVSQKFSAAYVLNSRRAKLSFDFLLWFREKLLFACSGLSVFCWFQFISIKKLRFF